MSTIRIKNQELRAGDDFWYLGKPYRIARFSDYVHPVVTRNELAQIAYSDGPDGMYKAAWGITRAFDHGWAASSEITLLPGDERGVPHLAEDDYLCPFYGEGAELYPAYAAAGSPGTWRGWLAGRD